jgi:hypothetical protein
MSVLVLTVLIFVIRSKLSRRRRAETRSVEYLSVDMSNEARWN